MLTGTTLILGGLALGTAVISAITGVGGGVVLLSGLILLVSPVAVVPIHGAVQFSAGLARLIAFRHHVLWGVVGVFILGMLPGSLVGALALKSLQQLNPSFVLILIALFILHSIWPQRDIGRAAPIDPASDGDVTDLNRVHLFALGLLCGVLGMFVGSTGPIVSGWLLKRGVVKEPHIGSKSVMQGSAHLVKLPLFAWGLDFDFSPYLPSIAIMIVGVIFGTFVGKKLLNQMSSSRFSVIVKALLMVIAIRILWVEIHALFA